MAKQRSRPLLSGRLPTHPPPSEEGKEEAEGGAGGDELAFAHVAYRTDGDEGAGDQGGEDSEPEEDEREADVQRTLVALSRAKSDYRRKFGRVKVLKSEVAAMTKEVAALRQRMLAEFDTWTILQEGGAGGVGADGTVTL